jgi:uncharacterized protein YceH (UPF0502 family)
MRKLIESIWQEIESKMKVMLAEFHSMILRIVDEARSASKADLENAVSALQKRIIELETKLENLTKGQN